MKYFIFLYMSFMLTFLSCSKEILMPLTEQDSISIFEEFWTYVDQRYIYFEEKGVDWDEVKERYSALISDNMSEEELFSLCQDALAELMDNHNRLQSVFGNVRKYPFTDGYEIHFSLDVIEKEYAGSTLIQEGDIFYNILEDDIGYIYIQDMDKYEKLPSIIRQMKADGVAGIILDIRNNGGGDSNPFPDMISDLIIEPLTVGYYIEKSGPGHQDNTQPIPVVSQPSSDFHFGLPIALIINRNSYSASSYMAAMFKSVPDVTLVGQVTGGGGGGNSGYQLSNGWLIAVSMSDFLDEDFNSIEPGVVPDVKVENTEEDLSAGIDLMLEKAIEVVKN